MKVNFNSLTATAVKLFSAIMMTMQSLRNSRLIARLVLAWFALYLGVGLAATLVSPHEMQLVCSANGAMKIVSVEGNGDIKNSGPNLYCPFCIETIAPPPLEVVVVTEVPPAEFVPRLPHDSLLPLDLSRSPPARGPPDFS
jgi:hypothetical protein